MNRKKCFNTIWRSKWKLKIRERRRIFSEQMIGIARSDAKMGRLNIKLISHEKTTSESASISNYMSGLIFEKRMFFCLIENSKYHNSKSHQHKMRIKKLEDNLWSNKETVSELRSEAVLRLVVLFVFFSEEDGSSILLCRIRVIVLLNDKNIESIDLRCSRDYHFIATTLVRDAVDKRRVADVY